MAYQLLCKNCGMPLGTAHSDCEIEAGCRCGNVTAFSVHKGRVSSTLARLTDERREFYARLIGPAPKEHMTHAEIDALMRQARDVDSSRCR